MTVGEGISPIEKKPRLSLKFLKQKSNASRKLLPDNEPNMEGPQTAATAPSGSSESMDAMECLKQEGASDNQDTLEAEEIPCVSGLDNLGNTCFLNSVLQLLRHTPGFVGELDTLSKKIALHEKQQQLKKGKDKAHKESSDAETDDIGSLQVQLVTHLNKLYTKMHTHEDNYAVDTMERISTKPEKIMNIIRQLNPMFEGNLQHDAHELLRCLLTYIQDAAKVITQARDSSAMKSSIKGPKQSMISNFFKFKNRSEKKESIVFEKTPKNNLLSKTLSPKSKIFTANEVVNDITQESGPNEPLNELTEGKELDSAVRWGYCNGEDVSGIDSLPQLSLSPKSKKLHADAVFAALENCKPLIHSASDSGIGASTCTGRSTPQSMLSVSEPDLAERQGSGRKRTLSSTSDVEMGHFKKSKSETLQSTNDERTNRKQRKSKQEKSSKEESKTQPSIMAAFARRCKNAVKRLGMRGAFVKVNITPEKVKNQVFPDLDHQERYTSKSTAADNPGKAGIFPVNLDQPFSSPDSKLQELPTVSVLKMSPRDIAKYSPRKLCNSKLTFDETSISKNASSSRIETGLVKTGPIPSDVVRPESQLSCCDHNDFIEELFQGSMILSTRCQECETHTKRSEIYQDVSIPVRRYKELDSDDEQDVSKKETTSTTSLQIISEHKWLMDALSEVEFLQEDNKYFCQKCSRLVEAQRSVAYETVPGILTLHLKRFEASSRHDIFGGISKINDFVPTPMIMPCLRHGCLEDCTLPNHRYELYGVIMHSGLSISSGHYVSYVKALPKPLPESTVINGEQSHNSSLLRKRSCRKEKLNRRKQEEENRNRENKTDKFDYSGKWFFCDDDKVTVLEQEEFTKVLNNDSQTPYLLFYKILK